MDRHIDRPKTEFLQCIIAGNTIKYFHSQLSVIYDDTVYVNDLCELTNFT